MSNTIPCAYCGAPLDVAELSRKLRASEEEVRSRPRHCDRDHDNLRRQRDGLFKAMSVKGRPARSVAVTESNRTSPRRKPKPG